VIAMNFKDMVAEDISGVFLNLEEFGDTHTIGKKETICVIDEERFQNKQRNRTKSLENDGLFIEGMTLFIEKSFFKYPPHSGEKILVDGVRYLVEETKEDMGLLEIDLTRYDEK
jgi:hypothetical protein